MSIGKYIASPTIIGAVLGATSTAKRAKSLPNDWRRYVVWGVWAAGLALAVASVALQDRDAEYTAERKAK